MKTHLLRKSIRMAGLMAIVFTLSVRMYAQDLSWAKRIESPKTLTVVGIDVDTIRDSYLIGQFIGSVNWGTTWPGKVDSIKLSNSVD